MAISPGIIWIQAGVDNNGSVYNLVFKFVNSLIQNLGQLHHISQN